MSLLILCVAIAAVWCTSVEAAPAWHTSPKASVLVCGGSMMNGDHFADSVLAAMREHYAGWRDADGFIGRQASVS